MRAIISFFLVVFCLQANADAPKRIDVKCTIGSMKPILASLSDCSSNIGDNGFGPYSCQGIFDKDFSAKLSGFSGELSTFIEITYLPQDISGGSYLNVNGQAVKCRAEKFYW